MNINRINFKRTECSSHGGSWVHTILHVCRMILHLLCLSFVAGVWGKKIRRSKSCKKCLRRNVNLERIIKAGFTEGLPVKEPGNSPWRGTFVPTANISSPGRSFLSHLCHFAHKQNHFKSSYTLSFSMGSWLTSCWALHPLHGLLEHLGRLENFLCVKIIPCRFIWMWWDRKLMAATVGRPTKRCASWELSI